MQLKEKYLAMTISNDNSIDVNNINVIDDNDDVNDDFITKNLCIECNVDMGDCNPRQLCGKSRCLQFDDNNNEDPPAMKKKKKKKNSSPTKPFLTMEKFIEHTKKRKATKWIDLDRSKIFRVTGVEEVTVEQNEIDGGKRMARVGTFEDSNEEVVRVWLPGLVGKELACINLKDTDTYIRSLGPKTSTKSGRTYHNFEIVKNQQTL